MPVTRDRSLILAGALTVVGIVVLAGLGVWQLQRLQWKNGLVARAETRSEGAAEPLPPPDTWNSLVPLKYEYRPVRLTGRFRHDDETHVYTVLSDARGKFDGQGWWVMTPLELAGGGAVMVNRGFVPEDRKNPDMRAEGQVAGEVTIEGLMRAPETRGLFVPDDEPENNVWFTRRPARMAEAKDLPAPVAPFFVDTRGTPPAGLPQGGETRLAFRNDHLGYALTWFGLAAALLGVFVIWARGRLAAARLED